MTGPSEEQAREGIRRFAAESYAKGDPTGWFEQVYAAAEVGEAQVPWADLKPNPYLLSWHETCPIAPGRALVVGCGYGDDAAWLAAQGWKVTAFDISPSAIQHARRRFAATNVDFRTADLLASPDVAEAEPYDLVVEVYTLQALPESVRMDAAEAVADLVGNVLVVIARGRDEDEPAGSLPWPLTRSDLEVFSHRGLTEIRFEDSTGRDGSPVRHFTATYRRIQPG